MKKFLTILIIFWVTVSSSVAQEATEEAPLDESLIFAAFTLDTLDISGIYSADWDEVETGIYVRNDDEQLTYILHYADENSSLEELLTPLLSSVQLDALPEDSETYESSVLEWTIYSFEYEPEGYDDVSLAIDLARAEDDRAAYVILMQTIPDDYEELHKSVFLPSLDAFGLELETIIETYNIITLEAINMGSYGIESAVPTDWQRIAETSFMRQENESDIVTLIIQSSVDMTKEEFANFLLESLSLPIELPQAVAFHETEYLKWSLHPIEITAQGTAVVFQIALAEDNDMAYMVVLLSLLEEADNLKTAVLLPLLDVTRHSDS